MDAVKNLFIKYNVQDKYDEFEKHCFKDIENSIETLSLVQLKDHFKNILTELHKRKK